MKPRKPPSNFAIRRGGLIRRARERAGFTQAQLATKIGLKSREAVSQYETGAIEEISPLVCRALVVELGMLPGDLAEDPRVFQFDDELPTMSTEARRMARRWDSLPENLRQWIKDTIDNHERLEKPDPNARRKSRE